MRDARQLTIDFGETGAERPVTPANTDLRSEMLRRKIIDETSQREPIIYLSFGSGSSGNSCYIGTPSGGGLIIDAGVDAQKIADTLTANGIKMSAVHGVCLTHDHSDHVRYVYKLLRNHKHLRLYCTNRVLQAMMRYHNISKRVTEYHTPIFKEIPFQAGGFEVTAFEVPHDARDNAGFCLRRGPHTFVVATDLGEVTERALHYMEQANYLMIEANYDHEMLLHGRYPEYLKARILTGHGHLDNMQTAALLRHLVRIPSRPLRYIFLCHLSQDNNTPDKAMEATTAALTDAGLTVGGMDETLTDRAADIRLMPLPRFNSTRRLHLRP